jgi:hypothetical protein
MRFEWPPRGSSLAKVSMRRERRLQERSTVKRAVCSDLIENHRVAMSPFVVTKFTTYEIIQMLHCGLQLDLRRVGEPELGKSRPGTSGQQDGFLIHDAAGTFASHVLQPVRIKNRDLPARIPDDPGLLKRPSRQGDARPLDSQHHGQELLRQRKLVRSDPVPRQHQPAGGALVNGMRAVACRRLGDLEMETLRIAAQAQAQRSVALQLLTQCRCRNPQRRAGACTMGE